MIKHFKLTAVTIHLVSYVVIVYCLYNVVTETCLFKINTACASSYEYYVIFIGLQFGHFILWVYAGHNSYAIDWI